MCIVWLRIWKDTTVVCSRHWAFMDITYFFCKLKFWIGLSGIWHFYDWKKRTCKSIICRSGLFLQSELYGKPFKTQGQEITKNWCLSLLFKSFPIFRTICLHINGWWIKSFIFKPKVNFSKIIVFKLKIYV